MISKVVTKNAAFNFELKGFLTYGRIKHYFEKGRTSLITLREYRNKLYVCKQLGRKYSKLSHREELIILKDIIEIKNFLSSNTNITLPNVFFIGIDTGSGDLLQIEEYCGPSLRYSFCTLTNHKKLQIINLILSQISSLITANNDEDFMKYSIEPTPDNYTYDKKNLHYVDLMPPLVRDEKLIIKALTERQQTPILPEVQKFTFFNQKGLYLTFLTKFGTADVLFFNKLYEITLSQIKNESVNNYIDNGLFRNMTIMINKRLKFSNLFSTLRVLFSRFSPIDRDLFKLCGLLFINDFSKIQQNLCRYDTPLLREFMLGKKCVYDVAESLVYSKYNLSTHNEKLKELVAGLVSLQYSV